MITTTQAAAYLDQMLGVTLPSFVVSAAVEKVERAEPAMVAAGYREADRTLMQSMAVAIVACAGMPRRIQSQGAPSGASRSFKHSDEVLTHMRRTLSGMDTAGTLTATVGPDPASATLLMVV